MSVFTILFVVLLIAWLLGFTVFHVDPFTAHSGCHFLGAAFHSRETYDSVSSGVSNEETKKLEATDWHHTSSWLLSYKFAGDPPVIKPTRKTKRQAFFLRKSAKLAFSFLATAVCGNFLLAGPFEVFRGWHSHKLF